MTPTPAQQQLEESIQALVVKLFRARNDTEADLIQREISKLYEEVKRTAHCVQ